MKAETISKTSEILAYVVMTGVLILFIHNAWFNKDLNITTPCEEPGQTSTDTRPVWEILGSDDVSLWGSNFEVDEYERLMQSCKAWQHNYHFLNNIIIPGIGLLILFMMMKQYAPQISKAFKSAQKEDYGFGGDPDK